MSNAAARGFGALAVDSGEESEEEVVAPPSAKQETNSSSAPKITKTARKKALKAAKLERQQPRPKRKSESPPSGSSSLPQTDSSLPPPGSQLNPLDVGSDGESATVDAPSELKGLQLDPSEPIDVPAVKINGEVHEMESAEVPSYSIATSQQTSAWTSPEPSNIELSTDVGTPDTRDAEGAGTVEVSQVRKAQTESTKKWQNIMIRTVWTVIMIVGFIGLLALGHVYMVLLVMLCQGIVYREVTRLFSLRSPTPNSKEPKKEKDPWSKTLNWYFFAVTNYFLYGESIIYYFKHVVFADAQLLPFATNHRIISFTLYTIGFVGFVMSLKKGYLKQQFGLFCWVHMSLLLIVVSSHFIVNNILEGLIWFFVPASLVICNDVFAYIWGITTGRTPLIALSPKKTVEGFVGAFFSTIVFGVLWGTLFMRSDYMICPVRDLGVSAWNTVQCRPNPIFVWREYQLPGPLVMLLSTCLKRTITAIPYAPYQVHVLVLSCFASLVAPFGGFFASGFKRAFDIKDFGDSIPGHGGMTDRMDCQFLMGVFTYVYYTSLVRDYHVTVGSVLQTIVSGLTVDEQLELIADLTHYLEGQGIKVPRSARS